MASTDWVALQEEQDSNTPPTDMTLGATTPEQPPTKAKGRKRLLRGLQRMSSSQSLLRLRQSNSSSYRGAGRGSISCISLNSSSNSYNYPLGSSYGSQLSNGFSTAPTSIPTTPCPDTPLTEDTTRIKLTRAAAVRSATSVGLPSDLKPARPATSAGPQHSLENSTEDYFSCQPFPPIPLRRRPNLDFWADMPSELRTNILRLLDPRDIVRCSRVSKSWHAMCFDGHLWAELDTAPFYQKIPADALVNIITKAGPFARDLNLRGCVQLWDRWRATALADACINLQNISLEGCRIDRSAVHSILYQNCRLVHINVSGLGVVTNTTLKIIAQQCPRLEHLNVSWCANIDTKGLRAIVERCPNLRELRAGEVRGFNDTGLMAELFARNTLERLILMNCDTLTEEAFCVLCEGVAPERDYLTGRALVPPRRLKHLDVSRCRALGDDALSALVANAPALEGLQLAKCADVTDRSLVRLLPTLPALTHLDLEELDGLTNATLQALAQSPCRAALQHLSISYCENLGDAGMLPVIKHCPALRSLELDNTRISDLVLIEAAAAVRARPAAAPSPASPVPSVALSIVVYDCQNVTWTGIREVLSRNAEARNARGYPLPPDPSSAPPPRYPAQIITLKVFYGYQPTVAEHTRRCLAGDFPAAARLERKWAEYMVASEEAGAPGGFGPGGFGLLTGVAGRRRRRRVREAAMMHADEEDGSGVGRRRRARSGGSVGGACAVM